MERPLSLGPRLPPYEPLAEGMDLERLDAEGLPRSTVVSVEPPPPPPPRDHLAWSLCTMLYANVCCLGLMALVFSVKSRDRKVLGDSSGARSYGSTAKYLNITAQLLNIFLIALVITIIALIASGTINTVRLFNHEPEHHSFLGPT
ncbi:dispanin subfamily A member 2b-like [Phalacrocorax carbo]|uniref:dispanin subfamily A member 2b-like n=1 Tax=Phalacrocorax carbo TaxID=9209 RepID=UPI0031194D77